MLRSVWECDCNLGLDAKAAALHDGGLLGELLKQVLPLARQLAKRAFGHKEDSPAKNQQIRDLFFSRGQFH